MRHRKPRHYKGQHRAAMIAPRTRYGVVIGTALMGAGVIAFGAGTALPQPPTDLSAAALKISADKGVEKPAEAAKQELQIDDDAKLEEVVNRPAQVQERAPAPVPELLPIWTQPIVGGYISSSYGYRPEFHGGVDVAAPYGTEIYAASSGVVTIAGWNGGYGQMVAIDHGNGIVTYYGHASEVLVTPGQHVKAGDVIAKVGSTGQSTGNHLHFEVRVFDERLDPVPYLADRGILI